MEAGGAPLVLTGHSRPKESGRAPHRPSPPNASLLGAHPIPASWALVGRVGHEAELLVAKAAPCWMVREAR